MGTTKRSISRCKIWWWSILIFVTVGSREYQFNRLLKELDSIIENKKIKDKVFAQIGASTYIPKYYEYVRFLSTEEFNKLQNKASLIISHGGTGSLIGALKKAKQVIAVPRLEKYSEHIDDHQKEVAGILEKEGYLRCVLNIKDLSNVIKESKEKPINKKYEKETTALGIIKKFIEKN